MDWHRMHSRRVFHSLPQSSTSFRRRSHALCPLCVPAPSLQSVVWLGPLACPCGASLSGRKSVRPSRVAVRATRFSNARVWRVAPRRSTHVGDCALCVSAVPPSWRPGPARRSLLRGPQCEEVRVKNMGGYGFHATHDPSHIRANAAHPRLILELSFPFRLGDFGHAELNELEVILQV